MLISPSFSFLKKKRTYTVLLLVAVAYIVVLLIIFATALPQASLDPLNEGFSFDEFEEAIGQEVLSWLGSSEVAEWMQENAFTTITAMFFLALLLVVIFLLSRKRIYSYLDQKIIRRKRAK